MVDHHWLVNKKDEEFVPNLDKFGFVYLITNLHGGKGYIGCKQYKLYTKLKERESDWKTYTGSSKWLNEDIKKVGKEHFKFEIIAEYKNRRSLRYYELYYQMKFNVLSSTIEGTDEPAYYNSRVGGKFYRPVESYEDPEYRRKQSESSNKRWSDPEKRKKISESLKNSEAFQKSRKDPEYRRKQSEAMKKRCEDPEYRKKLSEAAQKRTVNYDTEYRKKLSEAAKKGWVKRKRKKNARR